MTVMIVGEAYGAEEEKVNKPFIGKSGKILTEKLLECNIIRNTPEIHITNVFMERPPNNDISYFFGGHKQDIVENIQSYGGKFVLQKFKHHLDRLQKEIEDLQPKLILSLGNVPYWCFTGNSGGITKARGKLQVETFGPVKLKTHYIPTYHPSYILRKLTDNKVMSEWLEDLSKIKLYLQ